MHAPLHNIVEIPEEEDEAEFAERRSSLHPSHQHSSLRLEHAKLLQSDSTSSQTTTRSPTSTTVQPGYMARPLSLKQQQKHHQHALRSSDAAMDAIENGQHSLEAQQQSQTHGHGHVSNKRQDVTYEPSSPTRTRMNGHLSDHTAHHRRTSIHSPPVFSTGSSPSSPKNFHNLPFDRKDVAGGGQGGGSSGSNTRTDVDPPAGGEGEAIGGYFSIAGESGRTSSTTYQNGQPNKRNSVIRSRTRSKSQPDPLPASSQPTFRSATFGCSLSMVIAFLFSAITLGAIFHSNFYRQVDPKGCEMSWMMRNYIKVPGFDRNKTPFADKYGLYIYRSEYDYNIMPDGEKFKPLGIPVLFVPGNAGSEKQVRSIAKEAAKYYYENVDAGRRSGKTWLRPLDFFTVDFNEEFSALHGHSLLEQAQYLNDAIAHILTLYHRPSHGSSLPQPTSVLIVGHSMGGVVARSLFTMKNFNPHSVNTIVTAATPHIVPPVALDFQISNVYSAIDSFWTNGFQGSDPPLANVSLVSIAGGNLDIIVNGDSSNVHHFVPPSHGFSVFSSTIPHAWVGADHVAILWCNQIVKAIGKALVDVADARHPEQVLPLEERMKVFRNVFLTGVDEHLEEPSYRTSVTTFALDMIESTRYDHRSTPSFVYQESPTAAKGGQHLYLLDIPASPMDTFTMLTDHMLGSDSRLDVFLCNDAAEDTPEVSSSSIQGKLACQRSVLHAMPVPGSTDSVLYPFEGKEFRFISQKLDAISPHFKYVAILDRGSYRGGSGFLVAEFQSEANTTVSVETTTYGLLTSGLQLSMFPGKKASLVSTLRLPNVDNSLLTYSLKVSRPGCKDRQAFKPMAKQSSWNVYEDKYIVNVADRPEAVDINFHGDIPYFDRMLLPGRKGMELRFWADSSCTEPLQIDLQMDKYGSLGKVVIRHRMVVLAFSFLVVILTLRAQLRGWNNSKPFEPFGVVLSRLIKTTFLKFSALLAVIALVQSFQARPARGWERGSSSGPSGEPVMGYREFDIEAMRAATSGEHPHYGAPSSWSLVRLNDVLLGANDPFFWFLAPVFFQASIGIVILIWTILNGLVIISADVMSFISRHGHNRIAPRSRAVRRRIITTVILFIMVATFVPYQFAFIVAVLVHIVSCIRALLVGYHASGNHAQAAWDRFHYLMSIFVLFFLLLPCTVPVLMVWIRNLSVQWYEPFSSDHRLDSIAPFIFYVEAVTSGAMIPRTSDNYTRTTNAILNIMIVYVVAYGVRYSWVIFFLSDIWISWLLFLQIKDTALFNRLVKALQSKCRALLGPTKKQL